MAKLLSKHLEANFKYLFGMDLVVDVVFLVLSTANNDLNIYLFAADVDCEIRYVSITELKNIPYLSVKTNSIINVIAKENSMP